MANPFLFKSACFFGTLHLLIIYYYNVFLTIYSVIYLTAVATSLWNHSVTSDLAKWGDRVTIYTVFAFDILAAFVLNKPAEYILTMMTAVGCYFNAKYQDNRGNKGKRDWSHFATHGIWTIMHMFVIYEA